MEKSGFNLEEIEALIKEYKKKVAFAKNHPSYNVAAPLQAAVAEIEGVILELEEQAGELMKSKE